MSVFEILNLLITYLKSLMFKQTMISCCIANILPTLVVIQSIYDRLTTNLRKHIYNRHGTLTRDGVAWSNFIFQFSHDFDVCFERSKSDDYNFSILNLTFNTNLIFRYGPPCCTGKIDSCDWR